MPRVLWFIFAGLVAWCIYLAIGATLAQSQNDRNPLAGLVLIGTFALFIGAWALLLAKRGHRPTRFQKDGPLEPAERSDDDD